MFTKGINTVKLMQRYIMTRILMCRDFKLPIPIFASLRAVLAILTLLAQSAKRSLLTPEVRGSNPVMGEVFTEHC